PLRYGRGEARAGRRQRRGEGEGEGGARRLRTVVGGTLRVIGKVLGRLRPYRLAFAGAVLQVLLSGILELAKPWPLKVVVDNVLGGHPLALPRSGSPPPRGLAL